MEEKRNHTLPLPSTRILRVTPLLLLSLTVFFVLFFKLGSRGFENKDTVRYVEIVWEMMHSGDFLVPRLNTVIFTEKPILLIWLICLGSWLTGGLTPFIARFPSALSACGCVIVTVLLGRRLFNRRAGILAGFILCTSYGFVWEARVCRTDMLLTFFVALTLIFLYLGHSRLTSGGGAAGRFFILAYVAAGFAMLAKGPLGLALPALAFFFYLLWNHALACTKRMRIVWGVLIVLGMQAAWYIPFLIRIGAEGRSYFYEMYVYKENLLRFTTGFDHYEAPWYYFPAIASCFLPWTPFLCLYPILLFMRHGEDQDRDCRFPIIWFLSLFVFLSISSGKHSRYALPLYPAAALLVADFWDRLFGLGRNRLSSFVVSLSATAGVVSAVAFPIAAYQRVPMLLYPSYAASAVLLIMALSVTIGRMEKKVVTAFSLIVVAFIFAWTAYNESLLINQAKRASEQRLTAQLLPVVGTHELATYGPTIDRFGRRLALGFFMDRPVRFIGRQQELLSYLQSENRVFCLIEADIYESIKDQLPPTARVTGNYRFNKNALVLLVNR